MNQLSIDYTSRSHLRSRLTLGGRAFPRKPWTIGGRDSHSPFATHAGIRTRVASTTSFRCRFNGHTTLPYQPSIRDTEFRSFGAVLEPRYIFRAESLDQ